MSGRRSFRIALIGSDSFRGKEIQSALGGGAFPIKTIEFYDPDVKEEFSKIGEFDGQPKVVHHLDAAMLEGLDLVFLAADQATSLEYGRHAVDRGARAIDLTEAFSDDPSVPVVVTGVNDDVLSDGAVALAANPNPATIILSHVLHSVRRSFGIEKAVSVILEPGSVYEEDGIQELADQGLAMLSAGEMPRKVFGDQLAFNLLTHVDKLDKNGCSRREKRILAETRRVLGGKDLPMSLSLILAPVFHGYSVMTYIELGSDAGLAELRAGLKNDPCMDASASGGTERISPLTAAGTDKIFIGLLKKEVSIPRGFWIWAVADNLTLGSALNARGMARTMLGIS